MLPAVLGFFIDWLIVSGRINRQADAVNQRFQRLTDFSQTVLQPALRFVVVVTLTVSLLQSGLPPLPGHNPAWMSNVMIGGFILGGSPVLFLFCSVLLCSVLFISVLLCFALLNSALLCSGPFWSGLVFSVLFCSA